jgi:hypothetical protein
MARGRLRAVRLFGTTGGHVMKQKRCTLGSTGRLSGGNRRGGSRLPESWLIQDVGCLVGDHP